MTAAIDLSPHLRAARRTLLYLVVGLGQGLTYLLVIGGGLALGFVLAPLWIGLPLLVGTARLTWRLAEGERRQANRLLASHIPPVPPPPPGRGVRQQLGNRTYWRIAAMLLLKLPTVLLGLVIGLAPVLLAIVLAGLGISGLAGDDTRLVGPWELGPFVGVALCLLALPATIVSIALLEAIGNAMCAVARRLLATRAVESGPVREMLAERLGDRSLNIAYWLPEREIFVDDAGRKVELPAPESGRTWTAVEHEGARVEELRVSRLRIVEAADDARRRIERDLHDGAQQQLVSLALDLRMLKARLGDSGLSGTVDEIGEKLAVALAELREFARGIHPAFLSERGVQ